ncbi:MAG: hypothetical protein IJK81_00495 [Selenomonadaceae bacterium]|nr:hypothetical protein [Selenomonadaceae bacterium]
MTRQQKQRAFRRAWGRCYCDLKHVEESIPKETDEFRLELLKKREKILHDDIKVFEGMISDYEDAEGT